MFAPATKGGRHLHLKRGPKRAKKDVFAANRLAAACKRWRQGSGQGYDHPTKVVTRERDGWL